VSDEAPKRPTRWFWINVGMLCVLAPWATYWFQQHLQLYVTQILIIGGIFSLWVFFRAMWAVAETYTKVQPAEYSLKLLTLRDVSGVLLVAAVALTVLWFRTASIYVKYEGAPGEGEYRVEVVRKSDGSPLIPAVSLTAANAVTGRPFLWQSVTSDLECRILRPVKYEMLPCRLEPGHSTRIEVPGSFAPREFHLLRIVPSKGLYSELAAIDERPQSRYELEIRRLNEVVNLDDLRRQTIYTGAAEAEMPIVLELERDGALEHHLRSRLLAKGFEPQSAEITTAILSSSTRPWPTFYLRTGDRLTMTVRVRSSQASSSETTVFEGFPIHYTVTADKVQTAWLPE
jgi:hypothetical protein